MKSEVENLKDFEGNGALPCVCGSFIVLYHNGEYEVINGPFEEAIQHVQADRRYKNYDHGGATIVGYRKMYMIKDEAVERIFV